MATLPLSSHVNPETPGKAVDALLNWIKSQTKHEKAQLLEHDELIYLILTLKKIPPNSRTKPYKIPLPNPLHSFDGSDEFCLIIDDRSSLSSDSAKKKIKSESIPISKVLRLSKLKTDYKPFEAKRKLCGSYDLFFADRRIVPLLPKLIGKGFFKKKKIPITLDLKHKNWKEQIRSFCNSTLLYLRTGTCSIVKIGRLSQGRDEIVENLVAAIEGIAEIVPKKWANIRSFHLKSLGSLALPVYQAVPEMGLRIEGFKEEEKKDGIVVAGTELGKGIGVKKGKKKSLKRGRIHEVRYMDNEIDKLMTDLVEECVVGGEVNGGDELGGDEISGKMKKKKKKAAVVEEAMVPELDGKKIKKLAKLKKGRAIGEEMVDDGVSGGISVIDAVKKEKRKVVKSAGKVRKVKKRET
ncbi:uncharacterized protein LOC143890230 [Tasmannia lanceolata]|uniref:uncharacterized protein LOC143890230 n=1 Tax=Tasmannia lanceolata TaxID=3420 RepID=UPI004064A55C